MQETFRPSCQNPASIGQLSMKLGWSGHRCGLGGAPGGVRGEERTFAVEHEGCVALGQRLVLRVLARDSLPAHACVHDRVSVVFHLVPFVPPTPTPRARSKDKAQQMHVRGTANTGAHSRKGSANREREVAHVSANKSPWVLAPPASLPMQANRQRALF